MIISNVYANDSVHIKFKGRNSWNVIGYDSGTEDARNILRERHSELYLNDRVYDAERGAIVEKEEDTIVNKEDFWKDYSNPVVLEFNQKFNAIKKFQKSANAAFVRGYKNSYRGRTLANNDQLLKDAKECGIKTVIDLIGFDEYKEQVENNGMKYLYNDEDILNGKFLTGISKDDVDDFVNVVSATRDDNFFISCSMGAKRTQQYLHVVDLFNPDKELPEIYGTETVAIADLLYAKLTPKHKEQLGWTKEYEEKFRDFIANS